ncbi:MAG: hypothetical protein ACLFTT_03030 [Candidatus Hydrogenedentota bacterium]
MTGSGVDNWVYAVVGGAVGLLILVFGLLLRGGGDDEGSGDFWDSIWGEGGQF